MGHQPSPGLPQPGGDQPGERVTATSPLPSINAGTPGWRVSPSRGSCSRITLRLSSADRSCSHSSLVSATATTNGITVKWKASPGAGQYAVLRKAEGETSWTKLGTTNQLSYTSKSAVAGTKYSYTVRCMDLQAKNYVSGYDSTGLTVTAK